MSSGFYHRIAFALPFGLACTHAGVWQCRPAVTLSGRLTSGARSRASAVPSSSEPLHQPGAGIPTGTDEMFDILSSPFAWRLAAHDQLLRPLLPVRDCIRSLQPHQHSYLMRWAMRKYKRLRGHHTRTAGFTVASHGREPGLFAHWRWVRAY